MSERGKKDVVIVGGGIAGALLAKRLQDHAHVTLIDPKEYFEITWAALRSMVDLSMAERSTIHYSEFLPHVKLVTSWATNVTENEVFTSNGDNVQYDYLVIATGHVNTDPVTRSESILKYQTALDNIRLSKSILIIGGGPTGVELAGEIIDQFPEKKITLVHRGSRLLEFIGSKASQKALEWLTSKKVEVILGQSVNLTTEEGVFRTSSGETIIADCHFDCTGKPLGSSWLKDTIFSGSLDLQKRLAVDTNLRVKGFKNIFAIGDITNISELKQGYLAMRHAELVAKNVRLLLKGATENKLAAYKPARPIAFVSLGKKDAVAQLNCFTLSGCLPGLIKSGDLFVGKTRKTYGLEP
ncbi:hypothetical protein RND81_04G047400 [Saponaria officinalis]|uniref:FAD/NAD(P)-binding domain-containing protein n=1 Tax=Saponaria officinalis TaxID=3572 RepID=A0AAW1LI00_SAPOF